MLISLLNANITIISKGVNIVFLFLLMALSTYQMLFILRLKSLEY